MEDWLRSEAQLAYGGPTRPGADAEDAYHEVCGAPSSPAPGWDWKFDTEARRYRAIALRPKTPIPEWTLRSDMTPVPVDPIVTPEQAYHNEYGSPVYPAPGWQWQFNSRIERLIPTILEEPSRHRAPRFAAPKCRWLCRWHPNEGYYSLVREDDDVGEEYDHNLYEYDAERRLFKRYHPPLPPLTATKPRHQIEPEPEPPPRRRFFVRHPDGSYAVTRSDEPLPDEIYEYDAKKNRFVRVPEYGQREACK